MKAVVGGQGKCRRSQSDATQPMLSLMFSNPHHVTRRLFTCIQPVTQEIRGNGGNLCQYLNERCQKPFQTLISISPVLMCSF